MTNYIFEDEEVVLTGRVATKKLRNNKQSIMVEIKPKSTDAGDWNKWVLPDKLFKVVNFELTEISELIEKSTDK
jgi:hypothetical protein